MAAGLRKSVDKERKKTMKKIGLATLILLVTLQWSCVFAADDKEVTLIILDFAPFYIVKGDMKGTGCNDLLNKALISYLKQYKFKVVVSTVSRFFEDAKRGDHIFKIAVLKTPEREKFLYFSKPTLALTSHVVVFAKKKADKFAKFIKDGKVSLKELMEDTSLTLGIPSKISFGELDRIINSYRGSKHVFERGGIDIDEGLLRMMGADRIDYTIGYIENSMYIAKQAKLDFELMQLPIIENSENVLYSYMAAPKNEWGKKLIDDVNHVLETTDIKERYYDWYFQWTTGKTELSDRLHKEMILKFYSK